MPTRSTAGRACALPSPLLVLMVTLLLAPSAVVGEVDSKVYDVLVLGAGVSGLAAARTLLNASNQVSVLVLEARNRSGGRIHTVRNKAGQSVELGAGWIHGGGNSAHPVGQLVKSWGLQLSTDTTDESLHKNGQQVSKSTYRDIVITPYKKFKRWVRSNVRLDSKQSLQQVVDRYAEESKLSPEERLNLDTSLTASIREDNAADLSSLSAAIYDSEWHGDQEVILVGGYDQLTDGLISRGRRKIDIEFNAIITQVNYKASPVKVMLADGSIRQAKRVISTLPLGIMQANRVKWIPKLPKDKVKAMYRLNFDVQDKLIMEFSTNFWGGSGSTPWHLWYTPQVLSTPYVQFWTGSFALKRNLLVGWNTGGEYARKHEMLNDEQSLEKGMVAIKSMWGGANISPPAEYWVTRWGQDPFSLGSYSSVRPNATGREQKVLAKPLMGARLGFAGEATHPKYFKTVLGAYLSGVREGRRVLKLLSHK